MNHAEGLNVKRSGSGRKVVFVHGVGADLESWQGTLSCLQTRIEALTFDLRGHGESVKTHGEYSLEMFSADLLAIVDEAGWACFDLVGFSLGGLIAQRFALDYPDRVRTLTIISSVGGRTDEEKARVLARAGTLAREGARAHMEASVPRWFTDEFKLAHPEIVEARMARSLANDPVCYAAAYKVLATGDLADELSKLHLPAIVMTGEADAGSTPRMAQLMAQQLRAPCVIFPRLRHSVLLEASDQVALQIDSFLQRHPA